MQMLRFRLDIFHITYNRCISNGNKPTIQYGDIQFVKFIHDNLI